MSHRALSGARRQNAAQRRAQLARLRQRDGEACAICGDDMIFPMLRGTQPELATIDHIVSVHDGGSNRDQNARLAHRRCNMERSYGERAKFMPDPHGNPPHRFTVNGRRYHPTRYWDMFKAEYR